MFDGYASQDGSKPETIKQFRSIINHLVGFVRHDDASAVGMPDLVRCREHLRAEPVKGGKPRSVKTINDSYLAAGLESGMGGKRTLGLSSHNEAEYQVLCRRLDRLRQARCRPVAPAIVWRAEVGATIH